MPSTDQIETLRSTITDAWRWACGLPEASEVGERHPRYVEVTEGRDTGPAYSSCRDLAHWGLTRVGVRLPWLLRAELGTWAYGRPVVTPGFVPWNGEVEAGDVLVTANDWPRGRDAHVVCVLEVLPGGRLVTAEYGQPGGKIYEDTCGRAWRGRVVRVRLPFVSVVIEADAKGLLVAPDWPREPDTEPDTDPARPPVFAPEEPPTRPVDDPSGFLRGLDLSHHQDPEKLDWGRATKELDFLIFRATYGTARDRDIEAFVALAREHGIPFALYHFYRPSEPATAQVEAFRQTAIAVGYRAGDGAPWVDVEDDPVPTMQPVSPAWADGLRRVGRYLLDDWGEVGSYGNAVDLVDLGEQGREFWAPRPKWVAHWTARPKPIHVWGGDNWDIWQHAVKSSELYAGGAKVDQNVAKSFPRVTRVPTTPSVPRPVVLAPRAPASWWDVQRRSKMRQLARDKYLRRQGDTE